MSQKLAKVLGIVFVIIGVLGFIPNPIVGGSGMFEANALHNLVHIVIGVILIMMAKKEDGARRWLKIFGIVYLLVAILGFLAVGSDGMGNVLGLIAVNSADNWLHVILGVILLGLSFSGGKGMPSMPSGMNNGPRPQM